MSNLKPCLWTCSWEPCWQPIARNLPKEFVLGTRTCSWEPVLRTLAWEPVLAKLACKLNCFPFCPQNPRWLVAPSYEVGWTPMKLSHVILPSYSLRSIFWSGGTWWNWLAAWVGVVKAIDGNRFCQEAGVLAGRRSRRASFFGGVTRNSGKQQARCTKGNGLRARSRRGHRDVLSHKFHQIPQDDSIL